MCWKETETRQAEKLQLYEPFDEGTLRSSNRKLAPVETQRRVWRGLRARRRQGRETETEEDDRGGRWRRTMKEGDGDGGGRRTEEDDGGGRRRRTMEEGEGGGTWRETEEGDGRRRRRREMEEDDRGGPGADEGGVIRKTSAEID